jgi:hypothetical protein
MQTMRGCETLHRLPKDTVMCNTKCKPSRLLKLQTKSGCCCCFCMCRIQKDSCTPQDVRLLPVTMAEQPYSCCTLTHNHQ